MIHDWDLVLAMTPSTVRRREILRILAGTLTNITAPLETRALTEHLRVPEGLGARVARDLIFLANQYPGLTTRGTTPNDKGFLSYIWSPMTQAQLENCVRIEAKEATESPIVTMLRTQGAQITQLGLQLAEFRARIDKLLKERGL